MKTLVFNGSPRKNGDTVTLLNELKSNLDGEVKITLSKKFTTHCGIKPLFNRPIK